MVIKSTDMQTHETVASRDFYIATSYAWGRSDERAGKVVYGKLGIGKPLNANKVYAFGTAWAKMKEDFLSDDSIGGLTSLVNFFETFDWEGE